MTLDEVCMMKFLKILIIGILLLGCSSVKTSNGVNYSVAYLKSKTSQGKWTLKIRIFDKNSQKSLSGCMVNINGLCFTDYHKNESVFTCLPKTKYDITIIDASYEPVFIKNLIVKDSTIIDIYMKEEHHKLYSQ